MNELVAARFTIMFAQLLLVLLIPSTSAENVAAAFTTATDSQLFIKVFVGLAASFLILQMVIMATGINNGNKRNTAYQILLSVVGLVLYGWFIIQRLPYITLWYIWTVFNLIPLLLDVIVMVCNLLHFRKYDKVYE